MRARVIRDPIYGYIVLEPELAPVVDHPLFQRLRRVTQTSLTSSVYPSVIGSRFEHGLGAMHLASRGWEAAWMNSRDTVRRHFIASARNDIPSLSEDADTFHAQIRLAVSGCALLHDVGHPPFSHALEQSYRSSALAAATAAGVDIAANDEWSRLEDGRLSFHEFAGHAITRQICRDAFGEDPDLRGTREALLAAVESPPNAATWAGALHSIVAGEVDVDRLDYLIRDSYRAGTEFGGIDYYRLVEALELHRHVTGGHESFRVAPGIRARSAVETLLVQRFQSYQWIHFHPRVVGFNLALRRAFELLDRLADRRDPGSKTRPTSQTLLRALRPNLVFWAPEQVDVSAALGIPYVPERDQPAQSIAQQSLDIVPLGDEAELTRRLQLAPDRILEIEAAVDDSTVIEALKRAYFVSRAEPSRSDPGTPDSLHQLGVYTRAALFRRKNFVPVWKTAEEYRDAAEAMAPALRERVVRALERRGNLARSDAERDTLFGLAAGLREFLDWDAVVGLNKLVDALLCRQEILRFLRRRLNESLALEPQGFWDLAYAGYGLRKSPAHAIQLYVGDESVPLETRSPLARAVADAEATRVKLYVFLFFMSHDFSGPDAESASAHRRTVRERLQTSLPDLIEEALEEVVR